MKTISSAEFRKTYAKLTDVTRVTVNGHLIGWWSPTDYNVEDDVKHDPDRGQYAATGRSTELRSLSQAERDAILRKVNRG